MIQNQIKTTHSKTEYENNNNNNTQYTTIQFMSTTIYNPNHTTR